MFGNFLEETATGTGATLALAGATTGNIQFQKKFADGELVQYVVDDSGGTIKVGGVGTYVSATDDITRADTWNWNGTTYDDIPSSNITLSGGTHTVRCDVLSARLNDSGVVSSRIYIPDYLQEVNASMSLSGSAQIRYMPFPLKFTGSYDSFSLEVVSGGGNVRVGLYTSKNGAALDLVAVHDTTFSVGSTGLKSLSFDSGATIIEKGDYFLAVHNDSGVTLRASPSDSIGGNSLGAVALNNGNYASTFKGRTYGAMPDPADVTSLTPATQGPTMGIETV